MNCGFRAREGVVTCRVSREQPYDVNSPQTRAFFNGLLADAYRGPDPPPLALPLLPNLKLDVMPEEKLLVPTPSLIGIFAVAVFSPVAPAKANASPTLACLTEQVSV